VRADEIQPGYQQEHRLRASWLATRRPSDRTPGIEANGETAELIASCTRTMPLSALAGSRPATTPPAPIGLRNRKLTTSRHRQP
jgi:hypothetical protein